MSNGSSKVRTFETFCHCDPPALDGNDRCQRCRTQWIQTDQCIGRRRVMGQAKTVRCSGVALPGKQLCEVCAPDMCETHPAYEADNCPGCGTEDRI